MAHVKMLHELWHMVLFHPDGFNLYGSAGCTTSKRPLSRSLADVPAPAAPVEVLQEGEA